MKRSVCWMTLLAVACCAVPAMAQDNPYVGRWALTIPGGGAGWLGVTQEDGYLDSSILWGGGSVVPTGSTTMNNGMLYVTRPREVVRRKNGEVVRRQTYTDLIMAEVSGDNLYCTLLTVRENSVDEREFFGKRIPELPPAPDLKNLKYGDAITLFNGEDLTGWKLTNENQVNGWSVEDGVLVNNPVQKEGEPHISYGNLRTVAEFEDFNLTLDVKVPENGNSGIYLRGIYEVQVADTYGEGLDSHHMGGIYSRIAPSASAEKPAGQWQHYDITLADRHVTVILNGQRIIDNQPLLGCTGGALTSNEFKPGPIYLQGDHTGVSYRNIILTPVVE